MRVFVTIFFCLCSCDLVAQSFKINLSPNHQRKLNTIQSGHKQIIKYHKYYKKDSALFRKKQRKKSKHEFDSLRRADNQNRKLIKELERRGLKDDQQVALADKLQKDLASCKSILSDSTASDSAKRAAGKRIKEISKDKVSEQLAKSGHPYASQYKEVDNLRKDLSKWWTIMKDTSSSDSLKSVAKQNVKTISMTIASKNPKVQGLMAHYKLNNQAPDWKTLSKDLPGIDSLSGVFESSPDELLKGAENIAVDQLAKNSNLSALGQQSAKIDEMKQYGDMMKPEDLQAMGKSKGKDMAMDHFAGQADKLKIAQGKLSGLMNKYRSFDSNDLSSATKKNSLDGKTFRERLVLGGNFNVVSTSPVSVDMSPLIGYRVNAKFYMGLGINYRHTFSDSLRYKWYVSASNTSFRTFANYDVIKNFFTYAEYERAGAKTTVNDVSTTKWVNNYFIGIGRKMLLHPKLYMTVTALYNLNSQDHNPTYPRRFQVRIGFQTSDLAFRKKKMYYDR